MTEIKKIDEDTILFCGETYVKIKSSQKIVFNKDPEFWSLVDSIDDGDAIIFESDIYYKN